MRVGSARDLVDAGRARMAAAVAVAVVAVVVVVVVVVAFVVVAYWAPRHRGFASMTHCSDLSEDEP